jgi:hypothetical protein
VLTQSSLSPENSNSNCLFARGVLGSSNVDEKLEAEVRSSQVGTNGRTSAHNLIIGVGETTTSE